MTVKSALFLVQTPLHVINALEAISQFSIEKSTFFIVTSLHNEKWRTMMALMLPQNANKIYCIRNDFDVEEGTRAYAKHINYLVSQEFQYVFFADARLYIFVDIVKSLQNPSTYLMDDGTGTILAIHSLVEYGTYFDMSVSRSASRQIEIEKVKRKYGLWNLKPIRYHLFTVFDYESCELFNVVDNPMTSMCFEHKNTTPDSVFFIGQPFVKIKHMTEVDYLQCLQQACSFFRDKKVTYLPHPREEEAFITKLHEREGINVVSTTLTAEKYLMELDNPPKTVCGFLSTSLWNIAKFQKGIDVISFEIPDELFNPLMSRNRSRSSEVTDLAFIKLIYECYRKRIPTYQLWV